MLTLIRILKKAGILAAALAITGAVLYQFFGLRVVIYGGGSPHLAFVTPASAQADAIERHRKAQATAPAAEAIALAPAAATPPSPGPGAVTSTPVAQAAVSTSWSDFRGPNRDGHYTARPILTVWPNGELKPIWKQPVGGGYASFVITRIGNGDLAFTIEQRGSQEVVAAYDVATGRERWTSKWAAEFKEFMGGDGPRATPTYFDGYVYALGAMGELRALDAATGRTIWRTNILSDAGSENVQWGMAAAPLIVDGNVVVLPGGPSGNSVVAYNHRTGARVWSALDDRQAYVSPMLVTIDGVRQILVVSGSRMMGLGTIDGKLLWEYPWATFNDINAGQPLLIGKNRVFVSSGYDHGAAVIEVTMSGSRGTVREVWKNNRMKNQFSSSVLHEGYIYGLDESILACLDATTGELKWKGGRYGYGQIALASGHIIVLTEDGDLALVRATPEKHVELARFPALDGKTWNHPAFSNGLLVVRNLKEMAAFDLRPSLSARKRDGGRLASPVVESRFPFSNGSCLTMSLQIGQVVPDFEADTTEGPIKFHEWIGDSWAVLFSHPKDFTPVCTTELGAVAKLKAEFDKRNTKVIGLSVDPVSNHMKWADDIRETQGMAPNYPMIGDPSLAVSILYGMLPATTEGTYEGRTAADNQTVRYVFVIGPDKKVKLLIGYPMTTGRNFDEVLRVLDSLQLTAKHKVATPANWKQGDDVFIAGSVSDDDAKKTYPDGWKAPRPYMRIVPAPKAT